ncbi:hypothetical protein Slin15195_G074300 [Septoria linicola]|uniref:Uncharacterized protein n=1 Tax=Septoria linicola TaxID=215465 RepID=A0A9Q9AYJ5_9PEZI|nr:hypothetical protein Slin15195_G074300 [Septoria linicola]
MANHRPPTKKPKRRLPLGDVLQQISKLPLELKLLILEALIRRKPPHISAHGLVQHPFLDVTWPATLRKQIWLVVLHSAPLQTYVHRTLGPEEWLKGNITPGFVRSHDEYCGVPECKNFRITANFLVLEYKPGRFAGLRLLLDMLARMKLSMCGISGIRFLISI